MKEPMNKWLYRLLVIAIYPFIAPLTVLFAVDWRQVRRDIAGAYADAPRAFRRGGPL